MPSDLTKYRFAGGEISPQLIGRATDIENYDAAVAEATNFIVDYRGGLSNRPGSEICGPIDPLNDCFIFPFSFAPNTDASYLIVFGSETIRFIQDGQYVMEAEKNITGITKDDPPRITCVGHGYSQGDWVQVRNINGMTELNYFIGQVVTDDADHFYLDWIGDGTLDTTDFTTYTNGGKVSRIYTVASPFTGLVLSSMVCHQSKSVVTITSALEPVYELTRVDHTNWTLAEMTTAASISAPGTPTVTPSSAGTAGVGFIITAVDINGEESRSSRMGFTVLSVDYGSTAGSVKVTWSAPSTGKPVYYNVYRTMIYPVGADISRAAPVGFVGRAYGRTFSDRNIVPDFTITPPESRRPFADLGVTFAEVTAVGAGYTRASTSSLSGGGSGFVAEPVVDSGGTILGVVIINPGRDYVAPVLTFSVGAGATFNLTQTADAPQNNPHTSSVFQQRRVFAATDANPLTLEFSRPGAPSNFDRSGIAQSDDALSLEIDAPGGAPIKHLVATRSGLLVMSQTGLWQLSGGGDNGAITPTNALADIESYTGVSDVPPLRIDTDLLFVEGKGIGVRLLTYSDWTKTFESTDVSIYASHLFPIQQQVTASAWAADPFRLAYFVRADGIMPTLTLSKELKIYGWAKAETKGLYLKVATLTEDDDFGKPVDSVYQVVQRPAKPPGFGPTTPWSTMKYIERVKRRTFYAVEDAWFVDCGMQRELTYPAYTVFFSDGQGDGTIMRDLSGNLSIVDVGKYVHANGGRAKVVGSQGMFVTELILNWERPMQYGMNPQDGVQQYIRVDQGNWAMTRTLSEITNLHYLAGQEVAVLADGDVINGLTVDKRGHLELGRSVVKAIVGLGYQSVMKTLPPTSTDGSVDARLMRTPKVMARVYDTRGLKVGDDLDHLSEFRERTDEAWGEPTRLQEGLKEAAIESAFSLDYSLYFVQDYPLPVTLVGYTVPLEIANET